jgi:hypothetical protein
MAARVGFKPEALERIARGMGHQGNMSKFSAFLASDPSKQHLMERYKKVASNMVLKSAEGDLVKVGKYWAVEQAAGVPPVSLGTKNINKATKSNNAIKAMQTATPTGKLTKNSNGYVYAEVTNPDGSTSSINTGKTSTKHAKTLLSSAAPVDPAPVDPAPVDPAPVDPAPVVIKPVDPAPADPITANTSLTSDVVNQAKLGTVPDAGVVKTASLADAAAADSTTNISATAGSTAASAPAAVQTTATPAAPVVSPAETEAAKIKEVERVKADTETALGQLETKELELDPRAQVTAQEQTESSVSGLDAAQGEAITIDPDTAPKRVVEGDQFVGGEGYSGSEVDLDKVGEVFGTGEVKAASVADEMDILMSKFDSGNTPIWAKSAMRIVKEDMARRGISGSSMAGQAMIQASITAALPIATIDAGNKQAMALEKAKYRAKFLEIDFDQKFQTKVLNAAKIENAANMQFSADQQIVLENSRTVNTMNLQNLSNKQSLVLSEASALANLDMANLNNRQQAEVMNAQSFLQVDMANFTNSQQIEMFKTQSRIGALFSDQAAGNASQQFNATSENQMTQFFKGMQERVQEFNVSQQNTMAQFNSGQSNTMAMQLQQIQNQRDQFNAQNQLVIAQSNAQWRRQIATADTAATNRANEVNAQNALAVSQQAYANLWQERADELKQAWESAENSAQQAAVLALQESKNATDIKVANMAQTGQSIDLIGEAIGYMSE